MPPTKKPAAKTSPKGKAKTCNQCSETLAEVRAFCALLFYSLMLRSQR